VFQPHRYSRTSKLWNQFIDLFAKSSINHLVITDIYPASEDPIEGISSNELVKAIKHKNPNLNVEYAPFEKDFYTIKGLIKKNVRPNDLLLLQGAGKINNIIKELL